MTALPPIEFEAYGKPEPQGSSKGYKTPRGVAITSDNPRLKSWRSVVADAAVKAMENRPVIERPAAVTVTARFRLDRPGSLPKRHLFPVARPDLDKLIRAAGDALTGIVWRDDSQVVQWIVLKKFCKPGERPGVWIAVEEVQP